MYLKRLDIKNFRVFDEEGVSLIFNQGVNAIIGENNSGKSSVIDAIRIAYSTVTYKKDIFFSFFSPIFIIPNNTKKETVLKDVRNNFFDDDYKYRLLLNKNKW